MQNAGSSTGYKHTEESLVKLREHLTKLNREKGMKVTILDIETDLTSTYDSIRQAAEALGCAKNALHYIEKQQAANRSKKRSCNTS